MLRIGHGPAGATTLIVSLGFVATPMAMALLMAASAGWPPSAPPSTAW